MPSIPFLICSYLGKSRDLGPEAASGENLRDEGPQPQDRTDPLLVRTGCGRHLNSSQRS